MILEKYEGHPLDRKRLVKILQNYRLRGFNFKNYDAPMITLALSGAENSTLKRASDDIILGNLKDWQFYKRYNLDPLSFIDFIDWMEVSPGSPQHPSLKQYAGRMHSHTMMDLPFEPDAWITELDRDLMREYLGNDLRNTYDGGEELAEQIEIRKIMSAEYGVDVRSKSDAQVAEAVIKKTVTRITGKRIEYADIKSFSFFYKAPKWIKFQTPALQEMFEELKRTQFNVDHKGRVLLPEFLKNKVIEIGEGRYKMGLGGLHSQEQSTTHWSDDKYTLRDRDVVSYYPRFIIGAGMSPKQLGQHFQKVYQKIFKTRIGAKAAGNKTLAETLKIVLNGVFGKLGDIFSIFYAPELMIQTTISGQLALLMAIEAVVLAGFQVVSANTDGFVTKVDNDRKGLFDAVMFDWECDTDLVTEETVYQMLASRDVNTYVAFALKKGKIEIKRKGSTFVERGRGVANAWGMKFNPSNTICADAVIAFLKDGIAIEETVRSCEDIRRFVTVEKVVGGAEKDGNYLGKVIRWYYSTEVEGCIVRSDNQYKVPSTDGARPMMIMPESFPDDIDYEWYIRESYAVLEDIGALAIDPTYRGRKGIVHARLEDQKTMHRVELPSGVACCGRKRPSIRDRWVEYREVPSGFPICRKCIQGELL